MNISDTVIIDDTDGFVDVLLPIVNNTSGTDYHTIEVGGTFEGQLVGFRLRVVTEIPAGIVDGEFDMFAFQERGIVICSTGEPTRRFASMLARLYGFDSPRIQPPKEIELMSFALEENEVNFLVNETRFKVFHDPQDERNEYFELYLNFDFAASRLQFNEKDTEYRQQIVKAFTT